ncbi:MAG: alpha-amylase family glycosyl hydrolase, partial [Myxococcota bacterium]
MESGARWIERWRAAAPGAPAEVWVAVARVGADPAAAYDRAVAELRARGLDPSALGDRPPRRPAPERRRGRFPWAAAALVLAATAIFALAPWWLTPAKPGSDALYFVLVDRFADGTADAGGPVDRADPQGWHGGDLAGVSAHVDDLWRLGVGAVWLSPVSRARHGKHGEWGAYHGYWVEALDEVDPRFGTLDELADLSRALHRRGMKLYLDVVYNHVGPDAELVRRHPEWFHHRGDVRDWDDPEQVVTHDVHGLPDLAQENEEVYRYLRDASVRLVDAVDPDGFRVDAVRHLPEGFLARLGDELRAHRPGFELVGEVFDGDPAHLQARVTADRLDAVFDFPLYFAMRDAVCAGAPAGRLAAALLTEYGARPIPLADNHDLPRVRSACPNDAAALSMLALTVTARGTPSITYGTEAGLRGATEPDNRGDMVFGAEDPFGGALSELLAVRGGWPELADGATRIRWLDDRGLVALRVGETHTTAVRWGSTGWG